MTDTKPPLPVSVISGYLGAGKTSLVNRLLSGDHGQRIMVLVNDFGEIALDESLIESRDGDLIALANGCMCCQIGGDLYDAIDQILKRRQNLDHLLIETSGVADPAKIGQIAIAEPELRLNAILVLVDALNFSDGMADPLLADTLERQVRGATLLLVTKSPMQEVETIADIAVALAMIAPNTPIVGEADAISALLYDRQGQSLPAPPEPQPGGQGDRAGRLGFHPVPFASWSWQGDVPVSRAALLRFLNRSDLSIFRAKGKVLLSDGSAVVLHKVGAQVEITSAPGDLATSRIVCIGQRGQISSPAIEAAWQHCIDVEV
ncbi:MAG: GTP-binding protein [Nitratireductor sp.]|nr:GTP-binding protein [Nitratireductor sp.]